MSNYDALIIGAGPAGATTAYFLAEAGLKVAIVEKSKFPRKKVCGEYVSATTFPVLEKMGVCQDLLKEAGPPIRRVAVMAKQAVLMASMPPVPGVYGWGRALSRSVLDRTILDAAIKVGAQAFQPYKAGRLESGRSGQTLTIQGRNGVKQLTAPIVVAAHGSWEIGSLPTQLAKTSLPSDLFAFKAWYTGADLDLDLMALLCFPDGYGGMVQSGSGVVGVSGCIRRDTLKQCREIFGLPSAGENFIEYLMESVGGVKSALVSAKLDGSILAAGPIRPGVRALYSGGVFRVGNAAGEAHPVVAEGISMAVQSGMMLANHLVGKPECRNHKKAMDECGRSYTREWKSQFNQRRIVAQCYAGLAMSPAACAVLTPVFTTFPALITFGATLSGKTRQVGSALNS